MREKVLIVEDDALIALSMREILMLLRGIMDIPVLILTSQRDEGTRARAAAINPAAYLHKPVHAQEIIVAVETALARSAPQNAFDHDLTSE
jgi:DNA-binding response OmpR family regulator